MTGSLLVRRAKRGDDGFNLVELIVAMMIISVVLLLLVGVQISAARSVTEARRIQQATALANEAVEQMHSIPWNTLSRGMYSGFLAAAGGDPLVTGGMLTVDSKDGEGSVALIIAPPSNNQDLTNPARPLFDEYGSNKQLRSDPSFAGTDFTVKAYVTEPSGADSEGIVGIAVVVEWIGRRGETTSTTVWSEAYRGSSTSCGNADTQPFLSACQSFFEASAVTGNVTVGVSALDPLTSLAEPLLFPATNPQYTMSMKTASAAANLRSQQVNYVGGVIQFGGNSWDDNTASAAIVDGGDVYTLMATDDVTNQSGWILNPAPLSITQGSIEEAETSISSSSPSVQVRTRSDFQRTATTMASTTDSCKVGISAGQPCAISSVANNDTAWNTGSGYLLLTIDGTTFRMSRRLSEGLGVNGNVDEAWVARLASVPGSSTIGCTTVTGAGCVAAGADRTNAVLDIGKIITGTGTVDQWTGNAAAEGMVLIEAGPGCLFYEDSVQVERGTSQTTTAPIVSRCGNLRYWNGVGYSSMTITKDTSAVVDTAPVTWDDGTVTVSATTQVQVQPAVITTVATDPECKTDACTVSASTGSISIVSIYHIVWNSKEHDLIVTTKVTGSNASASYKAAPSAP